MIRFRLCIHTLVRRSAFNSHALVLRKLVNSFIALQHNSTLFRYSNNRCFSTITPLPPSDVRPDSVQDDGDVLIERELRELLVQEPTEAGLETFLHIFVNPNRKRKLHEYEITGYKQRRNFRMLTKQVYQVQRDLSQNLRKFRFLAPNGDYINYLQKLQSAGSKSSVLVDSIMQRFNNKPTPKEVWRFGIMI